MLRKNWRFAEETATKSGNKQKKPIREWSIKQTPNLQGTAAISGFWRKPALSTEKLTIYEKAAALLCDSLFHYIIYVYVINFRVYA